MATITRTIGATARDYSTMQAWEDDLDDTGIYSSGDHAVGECYNDAAFDESITINGGGTVGLASVTLTVAAGQRHDGTAGSGARIVASASRQIVLSSAVPTVLSWLEFNRGGFGVSGATAGISSTVTGHTVSHCLVHNSTPAAWGVGAVGIMGEYTIAFTVHNCMVWNHKATGGGSTSHGRGIGRTSGNSPALDFYNNTVFNCSGGASAANNVGFFLGASLTSGHGNLRNNISMDCEDGDYTSKTFAGTVSNNLSSDATAPGSSPVHSVAASDQFVSTTGGSEDLHLKAGADAIDAGVDLVRTPTGVNLDIDGRNRDVNDDTWDIGAHEFVVVPRTYSVPGVTITDRGNRTYSLPGVTLSQIAQIVLGQDFEESISETVTSSDLNILSLIYTTIVGFISVSTDDIQALLESLGTNFEEVISLVSTSVDTMGVFRTLETAFGDGSMSSDQVAITALYTAINGDTTISTDTLGNFTTFLQQINNNVTSTDIIQALQAFLAHIINTSVSAESSSVLATYQAGMDEDSITNDALGNFFGFGLTHLENSISQDTLSSFATYVVVKFLTSESVEQQQTIVTYLNIAEDGSTTTDEIAGQIATTILALSQSISTDSTILSATYVVPVGENSISVEDFFASDFFGLIVQELGEVSLSVEVFDSYWTIELRPLSTSVSTSLPTQIATYLAGLDSTVESTESFGTNVVYAATITNVSQSIEDLQGILGVGLPIDDISTSTDDPLVNFAMGIFISEDVTTTDLVSLFTTFNQLLEEIAVYGDDITTTLSGSTQIITLAGSIRASTLQGIMRVVGNIGTIRNITRGTSGGFS